MLSENYRIARYTDAVLGRGNEPRRLSPKRTRHQFGDITAANGRAALALATRYWRNPDDDTDVEVLGYRPPMDRRNETTPWLLIARLLGFHSVASAKQSGFRVMLAAKTPGYITEVADPEDEDNFYARIRFDEGHTWTCQPQGLGTSMVRYEMTWETPRGDNDGNLTEAQVRQPNYHTNRYEKRVQ